MNASGHREIAMAILVDTGGRLLVQQRDDVAGILQPGKVGLFGGQREGDETFLECVVREIHEEISYFVPAEQFGYLASFIGGDIDAEGGSLGAEFFIARDIPVKELVVTEGSLLVIRADEIIEIEGKLTPSARFAMKAYGVPGF
jgi:8-oxo-dGTP diphosphatase